MTAPSVAIRLLVVEPLDEIAGTLRPWLSDYRRTLQAVAVQSIAEATCQTGTFDAVVFDVTVSDDPVAHLGALRGLTLPVVVVVPPDTSIVDQRMLREAGAADVVVRGTHFPEMLGRTTLWLSEQGTSASSTSTLRSMMDASREPYLVIAKDGRVLFGNEPSRGFSGLSEGASVELSPSEDGVLISTHRQLYSAELRVRDVVWSFEKADVVVLEDTRSKGFDEVRNLSEVVDTLPFGIRVLERRDGRWVDLWQNGTARAAWDLPMVPAAAQLELAAMEALETGNAPYLPHLYDGTAEDMVARYACRVAAISDRMVAVFTDDIASSPRMAHGTTERMEAVGRLAGGLAHDLNNLLTVIVSFTSLVRGGLPDTEPAAEDLDEVLRASDRASQLTSQLLAVSRRQPSEPKLTRPTDLIESLFERRQELLGNRISLVVDGNADWAVYIDPNQLEQAVLHVLRNARDALTGGGEVRISTKDVAGANGDYVVLTISDDGPGISDTVLPHIFEPFFTTKSAPEKRGSGLGLAICYGIVHQSGGTVIARSPQGSGAEFEIRLPRSSSATRPVLTPQDLGLELDGTETVLVIDDEPKVRTVVGRFLEARGYNVLLSADGAEAIRIFAESLVPIDLVLTDVMMPDQNGPEVVSRLRIMRPDLRVLYMSGYVAELDEIAIEPTAADCVTKPFTEEDLLRGVRRALA